MSACAACGHENRPQARFCDGCGARIAASCAACGTELRPGARFCDGCGTAVAAAGAPSAAPERSPGAYTPKHLADRILQSRSALEGERKQVTVLFADVKGSMELASQLDPEEWHGILERFFEILSEGVHRYEGTVNQYTGDGIMALFGAPIAHEDHAQRACYAALHLRDAVRAHANEVRVRHGVPFGVRIGLNSGEVVVGRIGDDLRMDYTAQGHVVGLAQRMESLAESGHICLSEHTARLVEGYLDVRALGRTQPKGASEPVGLYDLVGVGAFRTRLDRSRARGLSAFVGRDRDMEVLEAALERARSAGGQVVGVAAEAGTGKSRLCAEFLDRCRARGIPVLEARGVAHGKSIPMLPMLELWRAFYGITEADAPEAARAKVAGRLLLMDESFRETLPLVFDLLGIQDPEKPTPAIDPEHRQKRLHAFMKRLSRDPSFGGTRVTLLEDLHWFDGASDSFLETIVESQPATRDLMLLNFRPEYRAGWMQRSFYQHLPLQPLGPDATRELLHDQLGEHGSVAALHELVLERTKGNPFFVEEVVQSLVESGRLSGERGAYRLTVPVEALEVPATVQAVLAARIDRLPEREKEVLQTAAVIGKTFGEAVLREVASSVATIGDAELDAAVSALVAAEFFYEASLYPRREYSFKHPLTQEVAQGSQLRERKARVHAAVAQALERAPSGLDESAAEIAHHWDEAGEAARAARWHRRAAEWAGRSDPRESLRHWQRVRELAPAVEDERERTALALEACQKLLSIGWRMGGSEAEFAEVFQESRRLAERSGDRAALARLVGTYASVRVQLTGSVSEFLRYLEEADQIASECGDRALRAALGSLMAFAHQMEGDCDLALAWSARVFELIGSEHDLGRDIFGFSPRAGARQARGLALIYFGRLEEAQIHIRDAEREAEASGDLEVRIWIHSLPVLLARARGAEKSAVEHARRGVELAEKHGVESSRVGAYQALATALLLDGNPAAALEVFEQSDLIAIGRSTNRTYFPQMLVSIAETQLALGRSAESVASAREAIGVAFAGGCSCLEGEAQLALARALLATDAVAHRAEIEAALDRARELVRSTGTRLLTPQILELSARLAAALGEPASAERLLREALELYRQIGATGHAARLDARLAR